ncbi:putative integrase zinc-binding domain-containing protein [Helianthus annuus]|nr:putative integrase zinc-binding domain-containing protein [Helianthus annuus]
MADGILYRKSYLDPLLRCVDAEDANYLIREVHEGICGIHAGPRMVVAKVMNVGYYWPGMYLDAVKELRKCSGCQRYAPKTMRPKNELVPVTTAWPFQQWGIDMVGPLKSLHDWKQKFFYIRCGVIPIDMPYRQVSQGIPKVDVMEDYAAQDWYKKITQKATAISQLEEMALVGAGMSLLWMPKNPLGQPVYSYQGKFGYSLLNVLDPKAAGAMVEAIQADGNPTWLDQIRGRFLHPTDESLSRYASEVLGEDVWNDPVDPDREEVIVLSSGSSDQNLDGLTSRCARAGIAHGDAVEPVHEVVGDDDDAEVPVDPSSQLESRKKTRTNKSGRKEGKAEGKTAGSSRKQPSTLRCLDYVVVEIFWRRYLLRLLLLLIGRKPRVVDISQITPPTSPPSRTVGLTPPRDDVEADKRGGEGATEDVGEGGGDAGVVGGDGGADKGKGVEVEVESSETTPRQTIYIKRPSGGGGATSSVVRSPQFEHNPADSWGNPACDDLPHAPRWNLTQGSRMDDVNNCHEFFAMSLPPAERMFQKNRNRFALLDDHVRAGVNFFATSQEILREWRSMGEETLEFEESKKLFAEEREKFNAEKKGLQWRVSDAEQKLEEQKQLNVQKQKDWEAACERTNVEMQSQRDAIVRLSGEKTRLADEAHQARLAAERKEKEYVDRIDKLERLLAEKTAKCQATELLAEETSADTRWLLSRGVPLLADRVLNSTELATYMFELGQAGYNSGHKFGYAEGKAAAINKEKDYHFELYKEDCDGAYAAKRKAFSTLDFAVVRAAQKLSRKPDGVALLKKALGDDADAAGGAGTSQT